MGYNKTKNIKRFVTLIPLTIGLVNISFITNHSPNAILGLWYCEELDKSTIKITKDSTGIFSGTYTKSAKPSYVGKPALKEVKYNSLKKQWEGTIISARGNKELDGVLILEPNGKLKVEGSFMFLSKTFYWKRIN